MAKNTALTKAADNQFNLVPRFQELDEDMRDEIMDELDDLDDGGGIDCRRIKLPTGKSKSFEVETDNEDDPDSEKEIRGVILFTHKMNARWEGDYGDEARIPVCSSWDGKQGFNPQTGEIIGCDTCPFNQFRADGSGKDCKNTRRIYLMKDGDPHLYLLTVPPTSLKPVNKQLKRLITGGTPYTKMVVSFTLEGAKSGGGIDYAKINVTKVGELSPEQWAITKQMREEIKAQYKTIAIGGEDYNTGNSVQAAPQGPADGFMDVAADQLDDAGLPFN